MLLFLLSTLFFGKAHATLLLFTYDFAQGDLKVFLPRPPTLEKSRGEYERRRSAARTHLSTLRVGSGNA